MRYLLCLLSLCLSIACLGQANDTLTIAERTQLQQVMASSMFGSFNEAYKLSKKGDSIGATNALLKVDPYYLFFEDITPANLDSALKAMHITDAEGEAYKNRFLKAYNGPKTYAFSEFSKMHTEDQGLRKAMEMCGDSFTCAKFSKRLRTTDSQHFQYLYSYVQKNGWPTVADGGLYAHTLAIHNHEHHAFYIPHLKKAVLQGQAILSALELIYYWQTRSGGATRAYYDTVRKFSFDVSSILSLRMPASFYRILQTVKQYCPVKIHLVLECANQKIYDDWCAKTGYPYKHDHIIQRFFDEMHASCPRQVHNGESIYKGTSELKSLRYEGKRPRMMLYVIY
jgi:hypothetical protein